MTIEDPFAVIGRHISVPISCYVAIGDSFTAATGCPPGEGWADRLAESLRNRRADLVYRNLARQGATSAEVADQLGPALRLEPDLVTVICGANDVLESVRPDLDAFAARLAGIFDCLGEVLPGCIVITATAPERWHFLELRPRTRRRVQESLRTVNAHVRSISAARGIPCLDVANHAGLDDPGNFSADGLHPSPLGHQRAASAFEQLLWDHTARTRLQRGER
jgi:lysophospholipase L1-like esterase